MGMASGHQITITPADNHIEVTLAGEKLASSDRDPKRDSYLS